MSLVHPEHGDAVPHGLEDAVGAKVCEEQPRLRQRMGIRFRFRKENVVTDITETIAARADHVQGSPSSHGTQAVVIKIKVPPQ